MKLKARRISLFLRSLIFAIALGAEIMGDLIALPVFAHSILKSPVDNSVYFLYAISQSTHHQVSIAFTKEMIEFDVIRMEQGDYNDMLRNPMRGFTGEATWITTKQWSVNGFVNGNGTVGKLTTETNTDGVTKAIYLAPENDISPVTVSVELIGKDGLPHTASMALSVVHKSFFYNYQVGVGYKCMSLNPYFSADVHEIDNLDVAFDLKRNAKGDECTSEITSGPTVVKRDETGKGSCDPAVKTGITLGRTMEVTDFHCTYTGSDNLLRFSIKLHNPDWPGYTNVLLLTGATIVDVPVNPSSNTELVPELHPKPYTKVVSPKTTTGEVMRTGWTLKEVD